MAQIDIQPKQGGMPWWAWLIGAIVLLAIAWWVIAAMWDNETRVGTEPYGTDRVATDVYDRDVAGLPIAEALSNPSYYDNQSISGAATVQSVVSDRAFWVGQSGQRMLVVLDQHNEAVDVNAGQEIALSGTVLSADEAANIQGIQSLEPQARQLLERENAFLYVNSPQGIAMR